MSNKMIDLSVKSKEILKSLIGVKVDTLFADEAESAFESIVLRTSNGDVHFFLDEENSCNDIVPIVIQTVNSDWTEQALGTIQVRDEDKTTPFYRTAFHVNDVVESVQVAYCMEDVGETSFKDICALLLKLTSSWIVLEKSNFWTDFWDWSIIKGGVCHLRKRSATEITTLMP